VLAVIKGVLLLGDDGDDGDDGESVESVQSVCESMLEMESVQDGSGKEKVKKFLSRRLKSLSR